MKSILFAEIVRYIHGFLIIFIMIGFVILPCKYLQYYILLIIIVILDWNDFDGMCILTKIENYFRIGNWVSKPAIEEGAPEFFRPFMKKLFNINIDISRETAVRANNFIFITCLLIGFIRYNWYCMNNKKL
jgi:hypothetical protein